MSRTTEPIDKPAVRHMFNEFLRGELKLANLTLEVTQQPMVAVRAGREVEMIFRPDNIYYFKLSEGQWEYLVRLYPNDVYDVVRAYFSSSPVAFYNAVRRYDGYVE